MRYRALSIVYPGGYYSWELTEVRAINSDKKILAARGIYEVDFSD